MALLTLVNSQTIEPGTRFMERGLLTWYVYERQAFGNRFIGKAWRLGTAERWLGGMDPSARHPERLLLSWEQESQDPNRSIT